MYQSHVHAHWLLYPDRKQLFSVQVWEVVRQKPPVRGGCEEEGKEVEEEEDKEEERRRRNRRRGKRTLGL